MIKTDCILDIVLPMQIDVAGEEESQQEICCQSLVMGPSWPAFTLIGKPIKQKQRF